VARGLGIELAAPLLAGLRSLAQRTGVTLPMVLLASYQALLHRYSGQEDVRVGVPIANRNRLETEGLIASSSTPRCSRPISTGR